jgi:hypothetical protein
MTSLFDRVTLRAVTAVTLAFNRNSIPRFVSLRVFEKAKNGFTLLFVGENQNDGFRRNCPRPAGMLVVIPHQARCWQYHAFQSLVFNRKTGHQSAGKFLAFQCQTKRLAQVSV